jgi:arginase/N-omega-hydroxy-L-arginine amidinohydrolase
MNSRYSVIVSQGRVADRTAGALVGARLTGNALGDYLDTEPVVVGVPTAPADDDWSESLPAANATLVALRRALVASLDNGLTPVLATNTCAASLATLPEVAARFPDAVVLWIDAHGDFNTPATTESGYLGGMVLAAACGLWDGGHGSGLNPRQVALVGARDIDPAERELLDGAGVRILAPSESTPEKLLDFIAGRPVWIHIDWDVLEPGYIPAAYKVPEGLLPHQVAALLAAIPKSALRGIELAEFEAGEPGIPERLSVELILETFQHLDLERH